MQDNDTDRLMTSGEVAAVFRVDRKTVISWGDKKKIRSFKTLGGHRRFFESEVNAILEGREVATAHTNDLDHLIAEVFHAHQADSIRFTFDPDLDDARRYGVDAWAGPDHFFAMGPSPTEALALAMRMRTSAAGGAE